MRSDDRFEFKKDPSNDMWIGPDGCHYDDQAVAMYFSLDLCGCGNPEEVHEFLVRSVQAFDRENGEAWEDTGVAAIESMIKESPDIVAEFVAHFIDSKALTEHGGSVYGSWLTSRGQQFIEIGPHKDKD